MSATEVSATATGTGEGEISTFGWDTAFAVRIENVNAAIAARSASPPSFNYVDPQDAKVFCKGEFANWRVVRGGDGDGVNVELPMQYITGQMRAGSGYQAYSCPGGSLIVTVRLHFLNVTGAQHHLRVKGTSDSQDVPVVELYNANFQPTQPAGAVYAMQAQMMAWCTANIGAFEYVFSIVDLNAEADTGAWNFLKPTAVSYAYVDGPDDEDAFLGVLAMTLNETPDTVQQVLDTRIVKAGEQGAFCIARPLLLKKIMFPNLQALWPKLQESDLIFSDEAIQLKPKTSVELPEVTYQGTPYTPSLKEFTLTIEGSEVSVVSYTETVVQEGVTAWCRDTSRYSIVKGTNKSGQVTLAYTKLPSPEPDHGHYIDESVEITDIILAAIVAIVFAVLSVLTGGAAGVLIAVVGALIAGLIGLTPQIAGLIQDGDAPPMDLLQSNIVGPTTWTDSKDFTISAVELNGSMRLGGALGFGSASAA